ncbi:hypothetical protein [Pleomorphomonas koreensis]|uniref:hypothetical protein n=1 Tax=Pleomorphomonas koreensis TaxID=257440 RepID=UPI0012EBF6F4|nr:hypothetical protein [Pleomorphomonas koreensis]
MSRKIATRNIALRPTGRPVPLAERNELNHRYRMKQAARRWVAATPFFSVPFEIGSLKAVTKAQVLGPEQQKWIRTKHLYEKFN